MKRLGNCWNEITAFDNLYRAWRKARRGKRQRDSVAAFSLDLEGELLQLQRELRQGSYQPGQYRLFTLYERKPRLIAAAPFRDRVVHHAVMNVIEPFIDRQFIDDSYACRPGKGVHRAVDRYQHWSRRYAYVLKLDISQYFPSIDHELLKGLLRRHIKDRATLGLLDRLIDSGPECASRFTPLFEGDDLLTVVERRRGIPIGNLTSQFFANLYLNTFDHWVKQDLRVKAYARYVDDMVFLGNDKQRLWALRDQAADRLAQLRLRLHPRKAQVSRTRDGLDYLGYRVFPDFRLLRNDNGHRFRRKLRGYARAYRQGRMAWDDFNPSVQSWIGHAAQADTLGLRKRMFEQVAFVR